MGMEVSRVSPYIIAVKQAFCKSCTYGRFSFPVWKPNDWMLVYEPYQCSRTRYPSYKKNARYIYCMCITDVLHHMGLTDKPFIIYFLMQIFMLLMCHMLFNHAEHNSLSHSNIIKIFVGVF